MKLGGGKIANTFIGLNFAFIVGVMIALIYVARSLRTDVDSLKNTDVVTTKSIKDGLDTLRLAMQTPPTPAQVASFKVGSIVSYQYPTSLSDFGAHFALRSTTSGNPDSMAVAYGKVNRVLTKTFLTKRLTYVEVLWETIDVLNPRAAPAGVTWAPWNRSPTDNAWNAKYLGVKNTAGHVVAPTDNPELPVVVPVQHVSLIADPVASTPAA